MDGWTHRWSIASPTVTESGGRLSPLTSRILAARGIGDSESAARFLQPQLLDLHDPSLLPGVDSAAERLIGALDAQTPIVIYGDYDVDGISAAAILYRTLKACDPECRISTYVPHRLTEGYGLNEEAIGQLCDEGAGVIITVDCGISAPGPARVAQEKGVDLIITDHHALPENEDDLPVAHALVHPALCDAQYPFQGLAGAGVAFKIAWRLLTMHTGTEKLTPALREHLLDMLALCSLGTVADVVPLVGENRLITRHGLARVKSLPFVGMQALIEASGLAGEQICSEAVGFKLGPRLNASGRLGHAREAMDLFLTSNAEHAAEIAGRLTSLNDERRRIEQSTSEQAAQLALDAGMTEESHRAIVLAHPDWHPGVIGIVCSRLVGRFHRPVVLLQQEGEICRGSCRSIPGFSIVGALQECGSILEQFGGHDMAGGLTLRTDRLGEFVERFTSHANREIDAGDLCPTLQIDCAASLSECTTLAAKEIEQMAPFGQRNPRPVVLLRGVALSRNAQTMGANGRHISMQVGDGRSGLRVVGWNWSEQRKRLQRGTRLDIAIEPKLNTWRGRTSVEGVLRDVCDATPRL